ncbi:MAG: glycogen debranching N-terminal domain-containing protein, partial [Candidatus Nanopelagicales bacterium]
FAATFLGRARPAAGRADAETVAFRYRSVGSGMRERIVLVHHGLESVPVVVELACDVDFAGLFEVKESRVRWRGRQVETTATGLRFVLAEGAGAKSVGLAFSEPAEVDNGLATWRTTLGPRQSWEVCIDVEVSLADEAVTPRFRCGVDDRKALPTQRLASWRATLPVIHTDAWPMTLAVRCAGEDLGSLRIFDPEHPDTPILAAGAPWFMTLFGRDSLLTGWMTLLADPTLSSGVLETLARLQGQDVDPVTEEEPGRILHEVRFGSSTGLSLRGGDVYFGSIDATPLFVMLLGELHQWGGAEGTVARLLPHADRALAWIEEFGDRDGDGYVEYQQRGERGLANQGWKDSWDAVRHASGELARAPIALCEVQGYVYAAYLARAHLASDAGDAATAARYRVKAQELRRRFNEDFWLEESGWYAMGLDADKRPIASLASNIGHCLWTGIIDTDRAALVAKRLMSDDLFSGWGIRTLAASMAAYNPVSYHNGSIWPHDNALCAAGLVRYGFMEEAHRLIGAQAEAAMAHGGRLPELFAGFERGNPPSPASYPASCSPQAWAAAAPLLWLRSLLRLDPCALGGQVWLQPELPPWMSRLRVEGIAIAGQRLDVVVEDGTCEVRGAGPLDVIQEPRPARLD